MESASAQLFPTDLAATEWVQFSAAGFSEPVCGVVYRLQDPVTCGLPLGGLDTGCVDLETSGLLGYSTIFNSHVPRCGPLNMPFLGISVGGETWVLCDPTRTKPSEHLTGAKSHPIHADACSEVGRCDLWPELDYGKTDLQRQLQGLSTVKEIHYWGHYPVADLEYETGGPVSVGLRAWAPFFPGDLDSSMIPGVVFEVHLRNHTDNKQDGTVALSFPGPQDVEAGPGPRFRLQASGTFSGLIAGTDQANYALGVVGKDNVRVGAGLGANGPAWGGIAGALPADTDDDMSGTVAVDFSLAEGQSKVVRFVLAWHSPQWRGGGHLGATDTNLFTHMYARHYPSALEAARCLAANHEALLQRILAWQQVVYVEEALPPWLGEVLVNNFHLITEVGMWAQAKPPLSDWCRPEDGLWGLNECPRGCPQIECGGNSYYGGMPVLYFFPELTLSTLRGYKAYQFPDGCVPWIFGGITGHTPPVDLVSPTRGYQVGQNGSWHVGMVARYWRCAGDDEFLRELYPYVKEATLYTFNVNPERPYGLISLPEFDQQEAFEGTPFKGMSSHVGIMRLYHLKMMIKMAKHVGDTAFAQQCREWSDQSLQLLEDHLWTGSYYLQHKDPATGEVADVIMGYQLDGEFMAWFDGLGESVLPPDRVQTILETLKQAAMTEWGPRVWSSLNGGPPDFETDYWTPWGVHSPSALMLAATYMFHGHKQFGLELARKVMENMVCRQGWTWDMPILYRGDTGEGIWGNDYGQMMMPWVLPAAVMGQDLKTLSAPGGLVDRIIQAAKGKQTAT